MTAAELASFRALLQAQAAAPPGVDRGLFARMRSRLTVVEGTGGAAPSPTPGATSRPRAAEADWAVLDGPAADPPPATPPVFGRREGGPPPVVAVLQPLDLALAVRPPRAPPAYADPSTPDELDDVRGEAAAVAVRVDAPTPGVIAGWSHARPPSAQRRLLGRLEAVLLAEREGLEARRAA